MRFSKMHGIGNDYVYVSLFDQALPGEPEVLARALSDRHYGIGGDGLILIEPSAVAHARMRMFNADGSESEMCGNGVRCVAKYVHDHGIAPVSPVRIETGRGVLTLEIERDGAGRAAQVRVDMGPPILEAARIPCTLRGAPPLEVPIELGGGETVAVTAVSMGNPHAVVYVDNVAAIDLERQGPLLERHPAFPRRVNAHFVQVLSAGAVRMRTWERGSGVTLACGTGACAVCVAGVLTGRTAGDLRAHLPGGDLRLEWAGQGAPVFMTGPAVEVFRGEWLGGLRA